MATLDESLALIGLGFDAAPIPPSGDGVALDEQDSRQLLGLVRYDATGGTIGAVTIASTAVVNAPVIGAGILAVTLASTVVLHAPTLAYTVALATLASTAAVNAPVIGSSAIILVPNLPSTAAVTAPSVVTGVAMPTIASTAAVRAPAISTKTITMPTIASTAVVRAPGSVSLAGPAPAGIIRILINGIDRSSYFFDDSTSILKQISNAYTFSGTTRDYDGDWAPNIDDQIEVQDGDTTIFSGLITGVEDEWMIGTRVLVCRVAARDFAVLTEDRVVIADITEGTTLKTALQYFVTNYLQVYGIDLSTAQADGPALIGQVWDHVYLNDVITSLVKQTNLMARIDENRHFIMTAIGGSSAPWGISVAGPNYISFKGQWDRAKHLNKVYLAIGQGTAGVTAIITGDGSSREFPLPYKTAQRPAQLYDPTNNTFINVDVHALGEGLRGEYFNTVGLTGLVLARIDGPINFDWGTGAAGDFPLPVDSFSVRWSGSVEAQHTETYTFYTLSDDGVRLWVNGVLLIDDWNDHGATENSNTIALEAGKKYDLVLEYYEHLLQASIALSWSSASTAKAIIPKDCLFSTPASPDLFEWVWRERDNTMVQLAEAPPGTLHPPLPAGYALNTVDYIAQFPSYVSAESAPSSTTDPKEGVFTATDIFDITQGEVAAASLLSSKSRVRRASFETRRSGLEPGMLISIDLPTRGFSGNYLIEEVSWTSTGPNQWVYAVKVVEGSVYTGNYLDTYRSWSGTGSGGGGGFGTGGGGTTVGGGGGGSGTTHFVVNLGGVDNRYVSGGVGWVDIPAPRVYTALVGGAYLLRVEYSVNPTYGGAAEFRLHDLTGASVIWTVSSPVAGTGNIVATVSLVVGNRYTLEVRPTTTTARVTCKQASLEV